MIKAKHIKTIQVVDPDTKLKVAVGIYKLKTGGIVGIDESFLANTEEPVYSPFDKGVELKID